MNAFQQLEMRQNQPANQAEGAAPASPTQPETFSTQQPPLNQAAPVQQTPQQFQQAFNQAPIGQNMQPQQFAQQQGYPSQQQFYQQQQMHQQAYAQQQQFHQTAQQQHFMPPGQLQYAANSQQQQQYWPQQPQSANQTPQQTPQAHPTSRWERPLQASDVTTFAQSYMPWVKPRIYPSDTPSPSKIEKNEKLIDQPSILDTQIQTIEQTQQYKDLVRKNPAAAAAMKAGVKCPDRLAIYIERAFSKCIDDGERDFMKTQLDRICTASKERGDFFIKQWELMPLPCLQRESVSYQLMNERLVRGDSNTTVPYPQQMSAEESQQRPQQNNQATKQNSNSAPNGNNQNQSNGQRVSNQTDTNTYNQANTQQQNANFSAQAQAAIAKPFSHFQQQHGGGDLGLGHQQSSDRNSSARGASQSRFSNAGERGVSGGNRGDQNSGNRSGSGVNQFNSPNVSNFLNNKQTPTSSVADQEMYKRLKRLEKFEQQQQAKASQGKPKLLPHQQSGMTRINSLLDESGQPSQLQGVTLEQMVEDLAVKGTCMQVEKPFFRLTSTVDSSEVRPEHILKEALHMLKKKQRNKTADYKYIDDQFRSLRQDLTVQHITNDFCINVYETHARIALENADLDQFNQCQTQLRYLYEEPGNVGCGNKFEFQAYQFLYYVFCELETQTNIMLKQFTTDEKKESCIQHALNIRKALAMGNYSRFFKLYREAPNMTGSLIDVFIDKLRVLCLQKLALAFIPTGIKLEYLVRNLAFNNTREVAAFLKEQTCVMTPNGDSLDCKQSYKILQKAQLKVRRCKKND